MPGPGGKSARLQPQKQERNPQRAHRAQKARKRVRPPPLTKDLRRKRAPAPLRSRPRRSLSLVFCGDLGQRPPLRHLMPRFSRVTIRVGFDAEAPAQALLEACRAPSRMNALRPHGLTLDLSEPVNEQISDGVVRLVAEATADPQPAPPPPRGLRLPLQLPRLLPSPSQTSLGPRLAVWL